MGNQPFVLGEQQSVLPFLLGNKIQISIGISGQNNHTAEALAAHVAGSVVQGLSLIHIFLVMVGTPKTVERMVENNRKTKRYTGLCYFLLRAAEEAE